MIRRVEILPRAKRQLYETALWWSEHRSSESAVRWLAYLEQAIGNLAINAERFPLVEDADLAGLELRQFNFGLSRRPSHRVVFQVDEDVVIVYAIRHLAQSDLTTDDVQ